MSKRHTQCSWLDEAFIGENVGKTAKLGSGFLTRPQALPRFADLGFDGLIFVKSLDLYGRTLS